MRSATLYVSPSIARDCATYAQLTGLDCADAAAEALLRVALDAVPELQERGKAIRSAIAKVAKEWADKHITPS